MEKIDKTQQYQQGTIDGAICPLCYGLLPHPAILEQKTDNFGRTIRRYFGWCLKCNSGYEVMQFLQAEKWHIHKYQIYRFIGNIMHCAPIGEIIDVQDLPLPAPVITGPGGDYNRQHDLNKEISDLLHTLKGAMSKVCELLDELLIERRP